MKKQGKIKKHLRLIITITLMIILFTTCTYNCTGPIKNISSRFLSKKELVVTKNIEPESKPKEIIKERAETQDTQETKEQQQIPPASPKPVKIKTIHKKTGAREISQKLEGQKINDYHPYIEVDGTHFFNADNPSTAIVLDLFIPLWQDPDKLAFADLRYTDRSGPPFEVNLHGGYRQLSEDFKKLYGIYGAFDRKRTEGGSYFNQLTLGLEYWNNNWFAGANFYQPIGGAKFIGNTTIEEIEHYRTKIFKNIGITKDLQYEKAMPGIDAEIGYEFVPGLIGYVGGYYFNAYNMEAVHGPKARLEYDWFRKDGKKVLGIFDKVGFMIGAQRDDPRGTTWYLGINVRLSGLRDKVALLEGVQRHMLDPVRRDIDIISAKQSEEEHKRRIERIPVTTNKNTIKLTPPTESIEPMPTDDNLDDSDEGMCEKHPWLCSTYVWVPIGAIGTTAAVAAAATQLDFTPVITVLGDFATHAGEVLRPITVADGIRNVLIENGLEPNELLIRMSQLGAGRLGGDLLTGVTNSITSCYSNINPETVNTVAQQLADIIQGRL